MLCRPLSETLVPARWLTLQHREEALRRYLLHELVHTLRKARRCSETCYIPARHS